MFMQVLIVIECGRCLHHEESYVKYFPKILQMNGVIVTEVNESTGNRVVRLPKVNVGAESAGRAAGEQVISLG